MSLKRRLSHLFSVKNTSEKYQPDFNHSNKERQPVHMQSIKRTMRHYSNIGNVMWQMKSAGKRTIPPIY